ncbi:MAG: PAS domain S-box protein, partial [Methanomicrobiales archaeon]
RSGARILGFQSPEDLLEEYTDLRHQLYSDPEQRDSILRILQESGRIDQCEVRFKIPGGEERRLRLTARMAAICPDESFTLQGFFEDITGQKLAEEELRERHRELKHAYAELESTYEELNATEEEVRSNFEEIRRSERELAESEERYRRIVETAEEGIWELDADFVTESVNPRLAGMLGYRPDEMIGRKMAAFIVEEEVGDHEAQVQTRREGPSGRYVRRFRHRDGSVRSFQVSATPIMDRYGTFRGSFAMLTDITEQRDAMESLQESEERYRNLVENLGDLVYRVELFPTRRFTYVSPSATAITGYTPEEHYADPDLGFKLVHPDDRYLLEALADSAVDQSGQLVLRWVRKDGSVIWTEQVNSPVFDDDGRVIAIEGLARDITDRKMVEEALRRAHRQLSLLSGVTRHDILNRIMVVDGLLELLKDADESEQRAYLEKLQEIIHRIEDEITLTHDFERVGSEDPLWQDLGSMFGELEVPSPVFLQVDGCDAEVYADPLFRKVLENLLDDSVRHGGEDLSQITVSCRTGNRDLVIVWEDDGAGVSADEKERIFEKGVGKNTGFGLYLVREILGITGMTISETGTPGRGARFEIRVPREYWREKTRH